MNKMLSIVSGFLVFLNVSAFNPEEHQNKINNKNIRTVQVYKTGWELSFPIIQLNSKESISAEFDMLGADIQNLNYTLIHCNSNWEPTQLMPSEYLRGFPENNIRDYELSVNTTTDYVHYRLILPNEDVGFKLSGNYILKVYRNYDPQEVMFTYRFLVTEKIVDIQTHIKLATSHQYKETRQEVDFTIFTGDLQITDPRRDLTPVVLQNYDWNNALVNPDPTYIRPNELVYDFSDDNLFKGGKEYRKFDIKSLRFQAEQIQSIEFIKPYYHITLFPDPIRVYEPYVFYNDINGKFLPDVQEYTNSDTEADYVFVHFLLPKTDPLGDYELYVYGNFTLRQFAPEYRMQFSPEQGGYIASLLVKQGYYNYLLAGYNKKTSNPNLYLIEGSSYQTENEYLFLVYYKDFNARYERLIGFQTATSRQDLR